MTQLLKILRGHQAFDFSSQVLIYALRLIAGILVGAYVARYLGAANFGIISFIIALVAMIAPFIEFGTKNILIKNVSVADEAVAGRFWGGLFLKCVISFLTLAVFLWAYHGEWFADEGINNTVLAWITGGMILLIPWRQFEILITAHLKNADLMRGQICVLIANSVFKIYLVCSQQELEWFLLSYLLDNLFIIINFIWISHRNKTIPPFQFSFIDGCNLLKESSFLMVSSVSIVLYMKSDILMIGYFMKTQDVGFYAVASALVSAAYFVPTALAKTMSKKVYQVLAANSEDGFLSSVFTLFSLFGVVIGAGLMSVAPFFIPVVYGDEYLASVTILMILALGVPAVALGLARSLYLVHHGEYRFILFTSVLGLVCNFVLNWIFIPLYGITGAAIASVVSYYVSAVGASFFFKKEELFIGQIKSLFLTYPKIKRSFHEVKR
ncbi:flippase [Rubritalea spongiae]|uniref:Flippase n=1 Tax=Rubritalea spongiae TaxID=430797 RepID=A0ABW5E100_9BACT